MFFILQKPSPWHIWICDVGFFHIYLYVADFHRFLNLQCSRFEKKQRKLKHLEYTRFTVLEVSLYNVKVYLWLKHTEKADEISVTKVTSSILDYEVKTTYIHKYYSTGPCLDVYSLQLDTPSVHSLWDPESSNTLHTDHVMLVPPVLLRTGARHTHMTEQGI